jgi:hypothetical protein
MAINTISNVRMLVTLSRETVARIFAYRTKHHIASKSEVIRTLIDAGLDSAQQKESGKLAAVRLSLPVSRAAFWLEFLCALWPRMTRSSVP